MMNLRGASVSHHELKKIPPSMRKQIREDAGISRSTLAEFLDVYPARIRAYEENLTPTSEEAINYWAALECMKPEENPDILTDEERRKVIAHFDAGEFCRHCRGIHQRACPRVRRMRWTGDEGSALVEIEFWPDGKWPKDNVIFRDSPILREPNNT